MEEIVWRKCLNNYILDLDKENKIEKDKYPFTVEVKDASTAVVRFY